MARSGEAGHRWWTPTACSLLAGTLLERGSTEDVAEARTVAGRGLALAGRDGAAACRVRCLAPLAEIAAAHGDDTLLVEADSLLAGDHGTTRGGLAARRRRLRLGRPGLARAGPARSRAPHARAPAGRGAGARLAPPGGAGGPDRGPSAGRDPSAGAGVGAAAGATALAEAGRPFLYFPLAHHFEQQIHVPHRLDRLGAGRRMDYATATPESIAAAIAEALAMPVRSAPIAGDGAARAAALLASLLD